MRRKSRLFPFLLLNVLISALTTLAVLWLWDNYFHPAALNSSPVIPRSALAAGLNPQDNSGKSSSAEIAILSVLAPGDPGNEAVLIKQTGEGQTWLTGWQLFDQNGHTFTFPELLLNQNGAVQVFTKPGVDTVIELFWGLQVPVWSSGEKVTLVDQQNDIRATYDIP